MPRTQLVRLPNKDAKPQGRRRRNQKVVLPPIHRDVLVRRGKSVPMLEDLDPETTVQQVYTPNRETVVDVPLKAIKHMPMAGQQVTRLVLCGAYHGVESSCRKRRCNFVHAEVDASVTSAAKGVHVNFAWRSLDECRYERYAPGERLHVAVPNTKMPTDVIPSEAVLKTKALRRKRQPLCHCAHYYYNRTCNLGAECRFIHAVFIDPEAYPNQRAPVPDALGRGAAWVAEQAAKLSRGGDGGEDVMHSTATYRSFSSADESVGEDVLSVGEEEAEEMPTSTTETQPPSEDGTHAFVAAAATKKYRRNPYSLNAPLVAVG